MMPLTCLDVLQVSSRATKQIPVSSRTHQRRDRTPQPVAPPLCSRVGAVVCPDLDARASQPGNAAFDGTAMARDLRNYHRKITWLAVLHRLLICQSTTVMHTKSALLQSGRLSSLTLIKQSLCDLFLRIASLNETMDNLPLVIRQSARVDAKI
jgi:hypothetical protein